MGTSSGGMWADMLGLGPVLAVIQDPSFHAQIGGFVASVTDVQARVVRIEAKLDLLLSERAHGHANGLPIAIAFTDLGPAGTGPAAATGGAVDDGNRGAGAASGGAGNGAGTAGADRHDIYPPGAR